MKRSAILSIATAFGAAFLCLAPSHWAAAHSWYDYECCSEKDCHPLKDGSVKITPLGYQVDYVSRDGFRVQMLINFGDKRIRQSRDQHFHTCEGFVYQGAETPTGRWIRCLYVPGGDA
jgi:hypothetical protein